MPSRLSLRLALLLLIVDASAILWVPNFARDATVPTVLIGWLVIAGIAYFQGPWAGIGAVVAVDFFEYVMLPGVAAERLIFDRDAFGPLPLPVIAAVAAAAIGRLRQLSIRNRKQAATLEHRERLFQALTEYASDLLLILDADGRATYVSPSHRSLLGIEPPTMLGHGYLTLLDERDAAQLAKTLAQLAFDRQESANFELRISDSQGCSHVLDVRAKNRLHEPSIGGIVLSASDISERRRAEESLETLASQALYDSVTGLPNAAWLRIRLEEELAAAAGADRPLSVLAVELDNFREVNEVLGHHWGDQLLRQACQRLGSRLHDGAALACTGGEHFVVLLPGFDAPEASTLAVRLVHALTWPYNVRAQAFIVGASIGIAARLPDSDAQTLLRQADVAMYAAKRRRDRISVFSIADDELALTRLAIAGSLNDAISNERLVLHFQPQVRIADGSVIGVEALVRWQHPEHGLFKPDAFVSVAEEMGLMGRLTDWVLRAAIRQLKRWQQLGYNLRMSVNLSAVNLQDGRLADTVERLLTMYDVDPSLLCLELTETAVARDADRAAEFLARLSALGVRLAIDDFGTGYSALGHLKQFPVDELKIDKSFILGILDDSEDAAIVSSTIQLAHRLGHTVVVEGVERLEMLEHMARLGADVAQGFAISEPLAAADFEAWLLANARHVVAPPASAEAPARRHARKNRTNGTANAPAAYVALS